MRRLLDNLPVKAASLALAVLLWFVIAGEKTSERGMLIAVELQNFPKDLELTGDPVNQVEVRLRASPSLIQQLGPGEISAQVDLQGLREGEHIIHLTEATIRVPFGVKVVKITPSILSLEFERTLTRTVPIRPRLTGRPAPGFELAELRAEPGEVTIAGPKGRVQDVESAFTEPVSVGGASTGATELVNVGLEDPLLRLEGGSRVRVTVAVREAHETRAFEGLRIVARGRPARLEPSRAAVTVTGPASLVRALAPGDLQPYVALPGQGTVLPRLPVGVEIAPGHAGISVLETRPAEVSVRVTRERTEP